MLLDHVGASLMTGRYVFHHGIHVPLIDSSRSTLPLNESTLAQRLKSAGYATHMVGKWHLGFRTWAHTPNERGFDTFYGYYAGSQDYWNHESLCWPGQVVNGCFENETGTGEPVTGLDLHRDRDIANSSRYSTTLYTGEADNIIRAHAAKQSNSFKGITTDEREIAMAKPLFLYLPHQAVHVGNVPEPSHPEYALDQAPARYIDEYRWVQDEARRNLSAMVTVMDEAAGNVTASLISAGMWDDTIFIFSTDNGKAASSLVSPELIADVAQVVPQAKRPQTIRCVVEKALSGKVVFEELALLLVAIYPVSDLRTYRASHTR